MTYTPSLWDSERTPRHCGKDDGFIVFITPRMGFQVLDPLNPFSCLYTAQMWPEPASFRTVWTQGTLNLTFLNTIQATSKRGTTRRLKWGQWNTHWIYCFNNLNTTAAFNATLTSFWNNAHHNSVWLTKTGPWRLPPTAALTLACKRRPACDVVDVQPNMRVTSGDQAVDTVCRQVAFKHVSWTAKRKKK